MEQSIPGAYSVVNDPLHPVLVLPDIIPPSSPNVRVHFGMFPFRPYTFTERRNTLRLLTLYDSLRIFQFFPAKGIKEKGVTKRELL
jgi:hypothetical protein